MARKKVSDKRGRPTGTKNLVRVDGGYKNRYGVVFTEEQKKALELSVDRSNYRRKRELDAYREKPHTVEGKVVGDKNQLHLMNKNNEFIVSHQPKTLQRFKSMEDYENFMNKQEAIQVGTYTNEKAEFYRENFINSLRDVYGSEADDIIKEVKKYSSKEYIDLVAKDEVLEISYAPSDEKTPGRLNQIRRALKIKEVEDWPSEEYDVE